MFTFERLTIPNSTVVILQRLGRTFERDMPTEVPAYVEHAAVELGAVLDRVDASLALRFREGKPKYSFVERLFDGATDGVWIYFRKELEGIRDTFGHPGLRALSPEAQATVELDELQVRAMRAAELHDRLFGDEGTAWVKRGWVVQAQTMATILQVIEDDGLEGELEAVMGPHFPTLLRTLQAHYEQVVGERMTRVKHSEDFRELRSELRWHLDRYKSAVELMVKPGDPETEAMADQALRALVLLNQKLRSTSSAAELDELLDDEDFAEVELGLDGDGDDTDDADLDKLDNA